jgi:hypothetical protein
VINQGDFVEELELFLEYLRNWLYILSFKGEISFGKKSTFTPVHSSLVVIPSMK